MSETNIEIQDLNLTRKDFVPGNEVRWCPGCGDYSVLANMQKTLPVMGVKKENYAFNPKVSGGNDYGFGSYRKCRIHQ